MAKGNMLMNLAQGKLGSMVFYRTKGEQRTRTYVKTVANPRSVSQMTQRTQLSNLVSLYRVMRSFMDKGFANKKVKQSDYNAFVSKNLNRIQIFIPKDMAKNQGCVVAPYQVSDGTIAPIHINGVGVGAVTDIYLGAGFEITDTTTIAQFSAAVIANNSDIIEGMQLSYVSVVQTTNPQTGYPSCAMNLYKVVFSLSNTSTIMSALPVQALSVVGGFLAHGEKVADGAFCWVLSRKDGNGKLNVSPQTLIVTSDDLYAAYSDAAARSEAGISYGETPDPFLNPASLSSGQGQIVNSIASVSVGGEVLKEKFPSPIDFAAGAIVVINGTGIETENVKMLFSKSESRLTPEQVNTSAVAISTLLTDPTLSSTRISGALAAEKSGTNQIAISIDGVVVYQIVGSPATPDPGL